MNESCPINYECGVDTNVVKYNAVVIFALILAFTLTGNPIFLLIVVIDFFLRVYKGVKASFICKAIIFFDLQSGETVNSEPKKFASKLGLGLSMISLFAFVIGLPYIYIPLVGIFGAAVGAEAFFDYCLACTLHPYYLKLKSL